MTSTSLLSPRRRPVDGRRLAIAAGTAVLAFALVGGTVTLVSELATSAADSGGLDPAPQPAPGPATDEPTPQPTPTPTDTPTSTPTATPTPSPTATDTPSIPDDPTTPPEDDTPAAPAMAVVEVQEHLRAHGFLLGPADGESGQQTTAAVMAFQRVNGLAVDGVVGPKTTVALEAGSAEPVLAGGGPNRIEVDLDRQLLHLVRGGQRVVTLQVSSGSGELYQNAAGTATALTPVGDFVIERRIEGERIAALGTMYDPMYFYRGFAIHGSPSVPPWPASHGCVRVTRADAAWLIANVPDGTPVHVYGGTHTFTP